MRNSHGKNMHWHAFLQAKEVWKSCGQVRVTCGFGASAMVWKPCGCNIHATRMLQPARWLQPRYWHIHDAKHQVTLEFQFRWGLHQAFHEVTQWIVSLHYCGRWVTESLGDFLASYRMQTRNTTSWNTSACQHEWSFVNILAESARDAYAEKAVFVLIKLDRSVLGLDAAADWSWTKRTWK